MPELMAQLTAGELTQGEIKSFTQRRRLPRRKSLCRPYNQRQGYAGNTAMLGDGMLPLQQKAAEQLFHEDVSVYRIYEDGTEGLVTDLEDLQAHTQKGGLFGVEKETWEGPAGVQRHETGTTGK